MDFVGSFKVGFLENLVSDFDSLGQKDQWRFIEINNSDSNKDNGNDRSYKTIIIHINEKLAILQNLIIALFLPVYKI